MGLHDVKLKVFLCYFLTKKHLIGNSCSNKMIWSGTPECILKWGGEDSRLGVDLYGTIITGCIAEPKEEFFYKVAQKAHAIAVFGMKYKEHKSLMFR